MARKNDAGYPVYVEEDFDVICEVCGTKWDFIDDKMMCPCCGDTLNKVEVATLKEEAFARRRKQEIKTMAYKRKQKKRVTPRNNFLLTWIAYAIVFGGIGFAFYKLCPDLCQPIIDTISNIIDGFRN